MTGTGTLVQAVQGVQEMASELSTALAYTTLRPNTDTQGVHVHGRFNHIVGGSLPMKTLYDSISRAAAVEATVLLRGETGTGKGLFARAIHVNSARHTENFVYVTARPARHAHRK